MALIHDNLLIDATFYDHRHLFFPLAFLSAYDMEGIWNEPRRESLKKGTIKYGLLKMKDTRTYLTLSGVENGGRSAQLLRPRRNR